MDWDPDWQQLPSQLDGANWGLLNHASRGPLIAPSNHFRDCSWLYLLFHQFASVARLGSKHFFELVQPIVSGISR